MIHASTVIFFGTSQFAVPILEALVRSEWSPRVVVTAPDRPAGRGLKAKPSPVKQKAGEYGLEVWEPVRLDAEIVNVSAWADRMAALAPDLFILAAYGKIIPSTVLAIPRAGSLNVHPSLLPRWRGPAPIQYAIVNGDPVTGVTVMLMDEEIDHGPILAQRSLPVAPDDTGETLEKKLSREGARLLLETIPLWLERSVTPKEQDHARATYTRLLAKEDGIIDWSLPASDIARRIRAFTPWPGSHTFWGERRITIVRAEPFETTENRSGTDQKPGAILSKEKKLLIAAGDKPLEIVELQLEGKRSMSGKEFLNGHRAVIGTRVGEKR